MFTEDIFPDDKTIYVKQIMAHYGESTESFMYEGIPTNRPSESHGEYYTVKLKNNTPGYVLTSLLNIDFEAVVEIIAKLDWKNLPMNIVILQSTMRIFITGCFPLVMYSVFISPTNGIESDTI